MITPAAAAAVAERFLTEHMAAHDFFSLPGELEEPLVIPFAVQPCDEGDALQVTFGLRISEDPDDPSASIIAIAIACIAALRAAHPELAAYRVILDYAT